METPQLTQIGFFKPILDALTDSGASVDRLLKRSGLQRYRLLKTDGYVTVQWLYRLFDIVAHYTGNPHLAVCLQTIIVSKIWAIGANNSRVAQICSPPAWRLNSMIHIFNACDIMLLYRYLYYDTDGDRLIDDMQFSGPALGFSFRF